MLDTTEYDVYIYHDNCMDGITAAAIALQSRQDEFGVKECVRVIGATHGTPINIEKLRDKRVCFLDFSVGQETMLDILEVASQVTVMDHHISVYDELLKIGDGKFRYVYHSDLSGAQIAWKHFIGGEEPYFIRLIGDRDLWKKQYGDSDILHLALGVEEYGIDKMLALVSNLLKHMQDHGVESVSPETVTLIQNGYNYDRCHRAAVSKIAAHAEKTTLDDGTPVMKVNCTPGFVSDVGAYLYNTSGIQVAWMYHISGSKTYNSLRVHEDSDYDAAAYAKSKGGGGHRKACGWMIDNKTTGVPKSHIHHHPLQIKLM